MEDIKTSPQESTEASCRPVAPYVIVSAKHTSRRDLYVSFWRPDRAGYCWPLSWAGYYAEAEARAIAVHSEDTFAIPLRFALKHSEPPTPDYVDDDAGPVIARKKMVILRSAALQVGTIASGGTTDEA